MEVAFVLGNGESRKGIQIEDLKKIGKVFACNGVYRSDTPDVLVAVDPKMLLEFEVLRAICCLGLKNPVNHI